MRLDVISVDSNIQLTISAIASTINPGETIYNCHKGSDSNDGTAADASHALATIGAAITKIPNYLLAGSTVNINAVLGDYPESITLNAYSGSGGVNLLLESEGPYAQTYVEGSISMSHSTTPMQLRNFYIDNQIGMYKCSYVELLDIYLYNDGASNVGVYVTDSNAYVASCSITVTTGSAIFAVGFSTVHSINNSGNGLTYGLIATFGAEIVKIDAVQPTGTTANERIESGGLIR